MSELRWILLLAGMAFLVGLAAWETRRARHAQSNANASGGPGFADVARAAVPAAARGHREPQLGELPDQLPGDPPTPVYAHDPEAGNEPAAAFDSEPVLVSQPQVESLELLEPIEPLAAELDDAALDAAHASTPVTAHTATPATPVEAASAVETSAATVGEPAQNGAATPQLLVDWPPEGERQIIALRLVGTTEQRLSGRATRQALAACGFVHGRYRIFHQPTSDGRALLSCASLSKPGNFDLGSMDFQRFAGLSLFTVLPGPLPGPVAIDRLLETARDLEQRLHGHLEDEQGQALDASRIAALRRSVGEQGVAGSGPTA